jgi:hypothetical protein
MLLAELWIVHACRVCVNTQPSLASRVCTGRPSSLPLRSTVSFFTTGTPVPSPLHGQHWDGFAHDHRQVQLHRTVDLFLFPACDSGADAFRPRSTDLAVTSRPASSFICSRP